MCLKCDYAIVAIQKLKDTLERKHQVDTDTKADNESTASGFSSTEGLKKLTASVKETTSKKKSKEVNFL